MVWPPVFLSQIIFHLSHLFTYTVAKLENCPVHAPPCASPLSTFSPTPSSIWNAFLLTPDRNATCLPSQSNVSLFWSIQNHFQHQHCQRHHAVHIVVSIIPIITPTIIIKQLCSVDNVPDTMLDPLCGLSHLQFTHMKRSWLFPPLYRWENWVNLQDYFMPSLTFCCNINMFVLLLRCWNILNKLP